MKIGLDVMGGDFAPEPMVLGAIQAFRQLPSDAELVLVGDERVIRDLCVKHGFDPDKFIIAHASQVIEMSDHPAKAFVQKADSSIAVGFGLLSKGDIDCFASAGSTGAMMVGAMQTSKLIPGVLRPCLAGYIPKQNGKFGILVDVGLNADCKAEVLCQYAVLGSLFSEYVFETKSPRVALLNIGSEAEKGNILTKATHQFIKEVKNLNFIGNVESNHIFDDDVDVIVCDGFVGNVILKEAEGIYSIMKQRQISDPFFDRFNYENYGGMPVLGIAKNIIVGHGISNAKAIENMIYQSVAFVNASLPVKIMRAFSNGETY